MNCAWQAYLNILPLWMRDEVDQIGKCRLQELRLRKDRPPGLITDIGVRNLQRNVTTADLAYCVNAVSKYSPWSATTIERGFITAAGGHRVGICGDVAVVEGKISTIRNVTSLCIRVARDFPGIGHESEKLNGSIIIVGSPGRGKTTLLRDIIRQKSMHGAVGVVDERREIFPTSDDSFCFDTGCATDVLSGCRKSVGVQILIRTMNPCWIAVDEITEADDCEGLIQAAWCGVGLLATAHAESVADFLNRPVYKPLVESGVFKNVIVMQPNKSWTVERLNI